MFDHVSIGVMDLARAAAFYEAVLGALGYVELERNYRSVCYGPKDFAGAESPFAIVAFGAEAKAPGRGFHIAFAASSREAVGRFHAAALAAGGLDLGPPGIRYGDDSGYYAAFVEDPDGHRIEAVLHYGAAASGS